jgi:hypothetical protein
VSWTSGSHADQEPPTSLIETGTANGWVIQRREFAKPVNLHSALVPLHLGAKNLDRALRIGQETRQLSLVAALCEEKSVSAVLRVTKGWGRRQQDKRH